MTFSKWLAVGVVCAGLPCGASAQDDIGDTRETLKQWVEARMTLGRVEADWLSDRETLKASIGLFEGELKRLDDQLKAIESGEGQNKGNQQIKKEIEEQTGENEEMKAALDKVGALLARFEAKFQKLHKRLPPPVIDKITPLFAMMPEDPAATKMTAGKRVQVLIGMLKAIDEFNGSVRVEPEVRQISEGVEIQVRTLYLGLGQAFYSDKNGNYAGTGTATATGWEWTENKALAPLVAKTLAIYDSAQPAAYVGLPIKVN